MTVTERAYILVQATTTVATLTLSSVYSTKLRLAAKVNAEYGNAKTLPAALVAQQKGGAGPARPAGPAAPGAGAGRKMIEGAALSPRSRRACSALTMCHVCRTRVSYGQDDRIVSSHNTV